MERAEPHRHKAANAMLAAGIAPQQAAMLASILYGYATPPGILPPQVGTTGC
jgi:hypothetical protein